MIDASKWLIHGFMIFLRHLRCRSTLKATTSQGTRSPRSENPLLLSFLKQASSFSFWAHRPFCLTKKSLKISWSFCKRWMKYLNVAILATIQIFQDASNTKRSKDPRCFKTSEILCKMWGVFIHVGVTLNMIATWNNMDLMRMKHELKENHAKIAEANW